MSRFVPLYALASLLLLGCTKPQTPVAVAPGGTKVEDGSSFEPDLQILDYDNIQRLVAKHRGKVVVMDAWSTSCPPCLEEFPKLVALSRKFPARDLACISLSFDYEGIGKPEDAMGRVKKFLTSQHATFDNVMSSEESDVLYRKFNLASVPAVFVYDRQGVLRKRFDNQKAKIKAEAFTYGDVEKLVAAIIDEPAN